MTTITLELTSTEVDTLCRALNAEIVYWLKRSRNEPAELDKASCERIYRGVADLWVRLNEVREASE